MKMDPRLIALDGPLKGSFFSINVPEFSIGRKGSSNIIIADYSISRQHCVLKQEESGFVISDLGSQNGTFVNGVPIRERMIQHGDRIQIGNSLLLFLIEDKDEVPPACVELNDSNPLRNSTIVLHAGAAQPSNRVAETLRILVEVSHAINATKGVERLCYALLDSIFGIIDAHRGVILPGGDDREASEAFAAIKGVGPVPPFPISRTVVEKVRAEATGLLCTQVQRHEAFEFADSLIAARTSSLIAVPMGFQGKSVGLIYIDTQQPGSQLSEDDLQLVTAIGGMAAIGLQNARQMEWLEDENRRLRSEINIQHDMIGEGPAMRQVYQFIQKAAPLDSTVLITGESGTGKELVARAIHRNSLRSGKKCVAINCAALPETLLESELFGYERGAFTGATTQKRGKLEIAQGGTVFLDEIGEMSPLLQAKLLRVLQEREFERVGGTQTIRADIRFIAATNRDLKEESKNGTFRQDLYYRLNVVAVRMPPLRERKEDISLLASYFATKFSEATHRHIAGISAEARAVLKDYDWPGNVRELENALERAVVLGSTDLILPEDLPESMFETEHQGTSNSGFHADVREAKKQLILKAVDQAEGNLTDAAKHLRLNPTYLHRLMRNLNLRRAASASAQHDMG